MCPPETVEIAKEKLRRTTKIIYKLCRFVDTITMQLSAHESW